MDDQIGGGGGEIARKAISPLTKNFLNRTYGWWLGDKWGRHGSDRTAIGLWVRLNKHGIGLWVSFNKHGIGYFKK